MRRRPAPPKTRRQTQRPLRPPQTTPRRAKPKRCSSSRTQPAPRGVRRPAPARAISATTSCFVLHRRRERSEEHTSELQSQSNLVCRLLLEKKKKTRNNRN